ncbi:MAG TPA: cobyric acid synthase [Victivallales bacterium]|nr:cobyric acid synthase [Victivallales bacterium]HPO91269.1 cobyric acid synthase [Victivallales bacterium]
MSEKIFDVHGGNITAAAKELKVKKIPENIIDFSVNINPYGPPDKIKNLISEVEFEDFIEYPNINSEKEEKAIADSHSFHESVILGNGTTELFIATLNALKPTKAIFAAPCYSGYQEASISTDIDYEYTICASYNNNFKFDLSNLIPKESEIVFICNPNNPTGTIILKNDILSFAKEFHKSFIAVDESFIDYLDNTENYSLITNTIPKNLIIFKSFTKFFAIPGIRLGAIFANRDIIAKIRKKIPSWNINSLAHRIAPLLYSDAKYICEIRKLNAENRNYMINAFSEAGIKIFPSQTNFLLGYFEKEDICKNFLREMLKNGFLIRNCSKINGLDGRFFRVAILDEEKNKKLLETVNAYFKGKKNLKRKTVNKKTKAIMIVGTSSDSGKSLITAALCKIFSEKGVKVAPFKAQNMALNSFVTSNGGEIGRAQAFQAKCANIHPSTDMNPILLKPTGDSHCQVIANGKVYKNLSSAKEYYKINKEVRKIAFKAYDRLSEKFDLIILEGAGSPAEINLIERDFVNMAMAEYANADTYLVADIDRGGVFAQIYGTIKLLPRKWRRLIKGVIINKFRGDESLLVNGLKKIEELSGVKVIGVLPFIKNLLIEEEDSLGLNKFKIKNNSEDKFKIDIAVIRYPRISNYTDFLIFQKFPCCNVRYIENTDSFGKPDIVFLPGTKNTRADLQWMKENKLFDKILDYKRNNGLIFGICGGYQMLGKEISDKNGFEGKPGITKGFSFLNIKTIIQEKKELKQVEGVVNIELPFCKKGVKFNGYEIHMGKSFGSKMEILKLNKATRKNIACFSDDNTVFGTYIHGLFDNKIIASSLINWIAKRNKKNINISYHEDDSFEQFTKILEAKLKKVFQF